MTASVETPVQPAYEQDTPPPSPEVLAQTQQVVTQGRVELETATFAGLMAKPRRKLKFTVTLSDDEGDPVVRKMRYAALSPVEWDALVAAHPATPEQREKGSTWNDDTFPPALIAAVSLEPKLTVAEAKALYTSSEWSPGERRELFFQALEVCSAGLNVPFSAGG